MSYFDDCDDKYEEMRDEGWRWGTPHTRSIDLPKYKKNLRVMREYAKGQVMIQVFSYGTYVAGGVEKTKCLIYADHHSPTTHKHVKYVADFLNIKLIKAF